MALKKTRILRIADKLGTKPGSPQRLKRIENLSLEALRRKVLRYRDSYYNGVSEIPDEEYDALENRLKELNPSDPILSYIGMKPVTGKKVMLPFSMPSLDKYKPDDPATNKWLSKHRGIVTVSDKMDGVSVLIQNIGKSNYRMYTRGNGTQGQDISYLVPTVAGIGSLKINQAVRGELIMPKSNFSSTWATNFVNARNLVSGAVNSNKADPKIVKDLVFVAHEMLSPVLPLSKAARLLRSNGFNVVDYTNMDSPTVEELESYLVTRKKLSKFEIDGLVLSTEDGDIIAFKTNAESKEATVKSIEWKLSQHKIYKPVVILTKPIMLSGANVTRVTAHNARYVLENGIGPGSVVSVMRSGEVIPKIVGVIKSTKPNFPEKYTWDSNRVEILGEPATSAEKAALTAKQLSEALRVLNVANIRERQLTKLVEGGIKSLFQLFKSDDTDFQNAGLGPTQADQLLTGLKTARLNATTAEMMKASGVFPKGYGVVRFEAILNEIPYIKLIKTPKIKLIHDIEAIPGFNSITARDFVKYLPDFVAFASKLHWKEKKKSTQVNDPLYGQVIVFTGFRNRSWEGVIKARGGKVAAGVTKATTLVIYSKESEKTKKAKDNYIRIMKKDAFARAFSMPT